ncbi:spore germination protein [Clostridium sp. ZS2-4]|uniref:spore germination protein n=1 Tax=Clostridium sp. ZS2-4 TaxID=2987703 RepID=UPI00227B28E6|nr:spore germination protein [Clostridium sp. ZS2-4]MCY6355639.1 spore germination protein [Clostridium sp. ZS2-4]
MNNTSNMQQVPITGILNKDIQHFRDIFKEDETILYREFRSRDNSINCCIIFIDSMTDKDLLNEYVIEPIIMNCINENIEDESIADFLTHRILSSCNIKSTDEQKEIISAVLRGDTVLLCDGSKEALIIDAKGWSIRNITEPASEGVVRGPREGFNESMDTNISLIRRKINSEQLKFKFRELGNITKTRICICYIQNLVSSEILDELNRRLDTIKIDGILESGYIEELIKDHPWSVLNTIGYTERPDVIAGKLLEGRIALMVDGSPNVLTMPFIFMEYFQTNEDYYRNFIFSSLNRIIRIIGFALTTSVPAIYVALTNFHSDLLPTKLLISISVAREGVALPTIVEVLLMLLTFEILREAGTRLPQNIGQTISIVGALVLGEAAVTANIVSSPMVIIVATTAISCFLLPKMYSGLLIIRLIFLILASILGLYGYILGVMAIVFYLMSLKSFGVEYMLKTTSISKEDAKDTVIRSSWLSLKKPKFIIRKGKNKQ